MAQLKVDFRYSMSSYMSSLLEASQRPPASKELRMAHLWSRSKAPHTPMQRLKACSMVCHHTMSSELSFEFHGDGEIPRSVRASRPSAHVIPQERKGYDK